MKCCNLYSAINVELERFAKNHVALFGKQQANELATERVAVTVIESAQTHLLL